MPPKNNLKRPATRQTVRDSEATRVDIINVAIKEFADKGLAGARIDEIAAKTKTSKRMIYYYFGGKEQLYIAALEQGYTTLRAAEASVALDDLTPTEALRCLTAETVDFKEKYPDFVRLVMAENINKGRYIRRSDTIKAQNAVAAENIERIYRRGVEAGEFKVGVDPIEIYFLMSALSFFRYSNQYTFFHIFQQKADSLEDYGHLKKTIIDAVLQFVSAEERIPVRSERPRKRRPALAG